MNDVHESYNSLSVNSPELSFNLLKQPSVIQPLLQHNSLNKKWHLLSPLSHRLDLNSTPLLKTPITNYYFNANQGRHSPSLMFLLPRCLINYTEKQLVSVIRELDKLVTHAFTKAQISALLKQRKVVSQKTPGRSMGSPGELKTT